MHPIPHFLLNRCFNLFITSNESPMTPPRRWCELHWPFAIPNLEPQLPGQNPQQPVECLKGKQGWCRDIPQKSHTAIKLQPSGCFRVQAVQWKLLVLLSLCLENCMRFPSNSSNLNHYDWRKIDQVIILPPYYIWNVSKLTLNHCIRRMNATEWSQIVDGLISVVLAKPFHLCQWVSFTTSTRDTVILWLTPNALIETTSHLYLDTIYPFKASGKTHLSSASWREMTPQIATLPPDPTLSPTTLASWWSLKAELLTIKMLQNLPTAGGFLGFKMFKQGWWMDIMIW